MDPLEHSGGDGVFGVGVGVSGVGVGGGDEDASKNKPLLTFHHLELVLS